MTTNSIAFIGTGAMGSAWIRGLISAGLARPDDIWGSDADTERVSRLAGELGIHVAESNLDAVRQAQTIVLAVKPWMVVSVLQELGPQLAEGQILISIAAGIPLDTIKVHVDPEKVALARVMPNTPALVRQGISGVAFAAGASDTAKDRVCDLLGAVGEVVVVEEKLLDAVTGLSGSGPAYVFVIIEALADGGVAAGLPRAIAQKLAIQTVLGSAALLKETGQHPAAAKDQVATPGGTTIAGLTVMEEHGVRAALIETVRRATERSHELSR
jgi:pyrroline-5-carboxylate reductase